MAVAPLGCSGSDTRTTTFDAQLTVSLHRDNNRNGAFDLSETSFAGFH